MINDVLDLERIESGRFEWHMGPTSLADVLARAADATAGLFDGRPVDLVLEVEPGLPDIVGDDDRLIQVVINLVSNAVKFTPAGTVTVIARPEDGGVVIGVSDTGIGIAAEDQETVWETFRQVGDTLTDKPRGTGLGLPISRQIVEHHGGRMWLDSSPGRGSTFWAWLPAHQPVEPASG
jgi:signal transduction histidine kinase